MVHGAGGQRGGESGVFAQGLFCTHFHFDFKACFQAFQSLPAGGLFDLQRAQVRATVTTDVTATANDTATADDTANTKVGWVMAGVAVGVVGVVVIGSAVVVVVLQE